MSYYKAEGKLLKGWHFAEQFSARQKTFPAPESFTTAAKLRGWYFGSIGHEGQILIF